MDIEKIYQILSTILEKDVEEIEELPMQTKTEDIGLDSLKFISFIVTIEEEYDIEISDEDLTVEKFATLGHIFAMMKKYLDNGNTHVLKKVIVCDCDNVLWHGVAGEEELRINSGNIRLQEELVELYHKGILICLCSRNEPINIDEAFDTLDMTLKREHIILEKIGLKDKKSYIEEIAHELNLCEDSFVFIDDSDYELGLIRTCVPQVTTIKADYNHLAFITEIVLLFQKYDENRTDHTKLYREQKEREKVRGDFKTVEEYNESLNTSVICDKVTIEQAGRISELSQRTNQFNMSGMRYGTGEILNLLNNEQYFVIQVSVTDCYGDMGIVGAAVIIVRECVWIENLYVSCRALGRNIEIKLLNYIRAIAGKREVYGKYIETEKNRRYKEFYVHNKVKIYV